MPRNRIRRLIFVVDPGAREPASSAEDRAIARDLVNKLRGATTPERWDAWLARVEGRTLAEIADEQGVPIGTVATRITLARKDLLAAIARLHARDRRGPR